MKVSAQKETKNKNGFGLVVVLGPIARQKERKETLGLGIYGPKQKNRVSVTSALVTLVSVSVSVSIRIIHENINGVVPRYIYSYIYVVIIVRNN